MDTTTHNPTAQVIPATDAERVFVADYLLAEQPSAISCEYDEAAWAWTAEHPVEPTLDYARQYDALSSVGLLGIISALILSVFALFRVSERVSDAWFVEAMNRLGVSVEPVSSGIGIVGWAIAAALLVSLFCIISLAVRALMRSRGRVALQGGER